MVEYHRDIHVDENRPSFDVHQRFIVREAQTLFEFSDSPLQGIPIFALHFHQVRFRRLFDTDKRSWVAPRLRWFAITGFGPATARVLGSARARRRAVARLSR